MVAGGVKSSRDKISDLIGQVYEAAIEPELWQGLATQIADTFDSFSTALIIQSAANAPAHWVWQTVNFDERTAQEYDQHYYKLDLWAQRMRQIELGRIFESRELVSDREFELSEIYQDWVRKMDYFYVLGSVFQAADGDTALFGIHRSRASGPYDDELQALAGEFLPHLCRALQMRKRLGHTSLARTATLDSLERTGLATLVVTGTGRIIYSNTQGEALLARGDGIRTVAGQLATRSYETSSQMMRLIREAVDVAYKCEGSPGMALPIPRDGRLPLTMLVAPFRTNRTALDLHEPTAILFIRDPETPTLATPHLQSLFGLTAAEAAIADGIAGGKSLGEIAGAHKISLNTARTHLKAVFAKTHTNRQAQLAALILSTFSGLV